MTQVYLSGQVDSFALAASSADCEADWRRFAVDFLDKTFLSSLSDSFLSLFVLAVGVAAATLLKSNAVPGVLGVFAADPNEAKAPLPSPNAEEPPVVGDDTALGVSGATELNGLFRPCDEVDPNRFPLEKSRDALPSLPSCLSVLSMDNDSLLTLSDCVSSCWRSERRIGVGLTWTGESKDYLCPCPFVQGYVAELRRQQDQLFAVGGSNEVTEHVTARDCQRIVVGDRCCCVVYRYLLYSK